MRARFGVALLFVHGLCAGEVSVRVLELFRPERVTLAPVQGRRLVVQTKTDRFVLEGSQSLEVALSDGRVIVERGPVQVSVGDQIARVFPGQLTIEPVGAELRLVATMPLEEAVAAIVAAEAGPGAPEEAVKAQAIASRSFLVASRGRHKGYAFCDTTHCQHLTEADAASRRAAEATAGTVLESAGAVVEALSTRRCGGMTRPLQEVGLRNDAYPYFPVACEACRRKPLRWERRWPVDDVQPLLAARGLEGARLEAARRLGWSAVPSNAYTLRIEGDMAILAGEGEGHGVGLCQFGAAELARQGWDAGRILRMYFLNAVAGTVTLRDRPRVGAMRLLREQSPSVTVP